MKPTFISTGDILFFQSRTLLGRCIRFFTQVPFFESRTVINHVAIAVEGGYAPNIEIVEALHTVKQHKLSKAYPDYDGKIFVATINHLPIDYPHIAAKRAKSYVGRKYGYAKLVAHFLDWCLLGANVFRRLCFMDIYPICSWVVAYAYEPLIGIRAFGVENSAASPDDIWDWCQKNCASECIREL